MIRLRQLFASYISLLVFALVLEQTATASARNGPDTPQQTEFFVLWGSSGCWDGRLTISDGRFAQVTPYLFTDEGDKIQHADAQQVSWRTETNGGVDGLHISRSRISLAQLRSCSQNSPELVHCLATRNE
jgi:hypothetical protein